MFCRSASPGERRSALFLPLLMALTIMEELLTGLIRGHSLAQTFAEFTARGIPELLANCLLTLPVLVPLMTVIKASRTLGEGWLRRFLLSQPNAVDD
jgi:hypothetical protein